MSVSTQPNSSGTEMPVRHERKQRLRWRRIGMLLMVLLCTLAAVFCLLPSTGAKGLHTPKNPCVVRLDSAWSDQLAAKASKAEMHDFIDQTVTEIQAMGTGINALAWNGRTSGGDALFRDKTGNIPTDPQLPDHFDAMDQLLRSAKKAKLAVYLDLPSTQPDNAAEKLLEAHRMPWLAKTESGTIQAGEVQLLDGSIGGDQAALALQQGSDAAGVLLGDWSVLQQDPTDVVLFHAFREGELFDPATLWPGKTQAQTLTVTYPEHDHATLYTSKLFLMGTSDPAQPLTLDGTPVERRGEKGSWGVLVPLEYGENTFTLTNGGEPVTCTVERPEPSGTLPPKKDPQPDGSMGEEAIGKKVVITDTIASALENPQKSASIQDTLYQGAAAEVVDVKEYPADNMLTHAYQLSTGGWVRAKTSTIQELADAALSGAAVSESETDRCTVLEMTGSGTPAVYHSWEGDTLTLTLLSTQWSGTLPESPRFTATAEQKGKDLVLTLKFTAEDPLYGWAVNYTEGKTRFYFKHMPVLATGDKPLTGLTILLDPGHGDSDNGAMGSGGVEAPAEKDANLGVAAAVKVRLEQLGGTVHMTREDDSFPSLGDRLTALNETHPDLFVSIHHNSIPLTVDGNQSTGTEAYWFYQNAQPLAQLLTQNLTDAVSATQRGTRKNRGERYGYYYVTRSNICPATLLEVGFMPNPAEYELCTDRDMIWVEAGSIARSIYQFFQRSSTPATSAD